MRTVTGITKPIRTRPIRGRIRPGLHDLGEQLDDVAHVGGDRLHRLEGEGLLEDHQAPAQLARAVAEPVVAPGDGRGQRALALGDVRGGGTEQLQPGLQALAQSRRRRRGAPARRPARGPEGRRRASGRRRRAPPRARSASRPGSACRAIRRNIWTAGLCWISAAEAPAVRHVERRDRDRLLRATPQGHPAGHEQPHGGQLVQEARDGLGAVGAGVDVVEHDERALVGLDVRVELAHERLHGRDHVVGRLALGHLVEVDRRGRCSSRQPGRRDGRRRGSCRCRRARSA